MLKRELDKYTETKKYKEGVTLKASSVPNEVVFDNKTVVTIASGTDSKVSPKNERLIAFLSIFFFYA